MWRPVGEKRDMVASEIRMSREAEERDSALPLAPEGPASAVRPVATRSRFREAFALSLAPEGPASAVRPIATRSPFRTGFAALLGVAVLLAIADYVTQGAP